MVSNSDHSIHEACAQMMRKSGVCSCTQGIYVSLAPLVLTHAAITGSWFFLL